MPPGIHGIIPYLNPHDPTMPAYTTNDAVTFVLTYEPWGGEPLAPVTAADIKAQFMTRLEANRALDLEIGGLAPGEPVCVVQVQGNFQVPVVFLRPPLWYKPPTVAYVFTVFDARTGNLLVNGGRGAAFLK